MERPVRNDLGTPNVWGILRLASALACALLIGSASISIRAVPAQPPQESSFKTTSAELVVLPVVVKDKQGRYIADLARERFVVYDNARRMPIDFFTAEDTPATIGLIVDGSGSMGPKVGEVIAATMRFAQSSNPEDEIFAIRFNEDVHKMIADERFLPAGDLSGLQAAMSSFVAEGRTALYDALIAGLDHIAQGTRTRRALIVISDGGDNASRTPLEVVLSRARKSNVTIYTVGIYGDDDRDKNPGVLKSLARETGGERFLPGSPGVLLQVCERIAREIRSGYTVAYAPPDRDGLFHRVRVALEPPIPHVEIRTRPGYFAAAPVRSNP
jgi:Ca-activated chloride channel homolog